MVPTASSFPSAIRMIVAGLSAFRSALMVMVPVTPRNPCVWAMASRTAAGSVVPARSMASKRIFAAS